MRRAVPQSRRGPGLVEATSHAAMHGKWSGMRSGVWYGSPRSSKLLRGQWFGANLCCNPEEAATPNRRSSRTRYLLPGNRNLARIRKAPLHERASVALGGMFGPAVREIFYCLAEGVKRGTIDGGVAKLILARVLPSSRPVQLDLPAIAQPANLIEAEEQIAAGLNEG